MTSHPRRVLAAITLAVAALAVPLRSVAATGPGYAPVIKAALHEFHVPGAAVAIYSGGRQWVKTFGLGNIEKARPVTEADHFAIRSITKSFVVTAVLQQIAASDGAVTLDDPIAMYLPDIPDGSVITIRELCGMTAGLFNYVADPDFIRKFSKNLLRQWSVDELLAFALHSSKHPAVVFPPGSAYEYSNTNTLVLGKLVEALSRRRFEAVLQDGILAPLQLRRTVYLNGLDLPAPAVTGYQDFTDNSPAPVAANFSSLSYSGAMASTIGDLAAWGAALADGTLLPASLQRERFKARTTAGDPQSPLYDKYGLGMGEVAGWWGHTGNGIGFQAAVFHRVATNQTIAIMLNAANAPDVPVHIFCRLLPLVAQDAGAEPAPQSVCDNEPR